MASNTLLGVNLLDEQEDPVEINIFFLFKDQNENFFSRGLNTKQGYPKTEILINGKIDPCLDKFKVIYTGDEDILMAINRCYDPFDVEDFK